MFLKFFKQLDTKTFLKSVYLLLERIEMFKCKKNVTVVILTDKTLMHNFSFFPFRNTHV